MNKIAIIGVGNVGSTVAYTLFTHGLAGEILLFDHKSEKIESEYRDMLDAVARNHYTVNVRKMDWDSSESWKELSDTDVIVTSFGNMAATTKSGSRQAELETNAHGAKEVGAKIKDSGFKGILLNISNPCDVVVTMLQKASGLSYGHVFGTGTFLDTSRMKRFVGEKVGVDPHNVHGYVLAEHGAEQFTAWSTVYVAGQKANELFSKEEEDKLSSIPNKNSKIVSHGKGYTNWAIASTATRLIEDVLLNTHAVVPVSNYDKNYNVFLSWPVVLGKNGIERRATLHLTNEEKAKYEAAAKAIQGRVKKAENL